MTFSFPTDRHMYCTWLKCTYGYILVVIFYSVMLFQILLSDFIPQEARFYIPFYPFAIYIMIVIHHVLCKSNDLWFVWGVQKFCLSHAIALLFELNSQFSNFRNIAFREYYIAELYSRCCCCQNVLISHTNVCDLRFRYFFMFPWSMRVSFLVKIFEASPLC